jgi:hypothetical protein
LRWFQEINHRWIIPIGMIACDLSELRMAEGIIELLAIATRGEGRSKRLFENTEAVEFNHLKYLKVSRENQHFSDRDHGPRYLS